MARLGRSFPVNWSLANRNFRPLNTLAGATLAIGSTVTASGNYSIGGTAELDAGFVMGNFSVPPATAEIDAAITLAPGGLSTSNAALPVTSGMTAVPGAWQYTGLYPVTYPQYLDGTGALEAEPGEAFVALGEASGWPYPLPVPPADGRWITLGGGGGRVGAEDPEPEEEGDPLAWDPPPHLAHLPVPFEVIAARIGAKRARTAAGTR